jgi:DNA (cytosine-5)-methyltransferase 1
MVGVSGVSGLIIDNFAGGGGASTGIEAALGRAVDIAINHDEEAIRMHEVNHPGTVHIRNNIWQIDPKDIVKGRKVDLAWFSPDCKHFSKAKGGKPREKSIRDLAWVVVLWAQRVRPDLILLENVEEFRTWGPLCDQGFPIKDRAGETFKKWSSELRKAGYKIEWKELRACDYGAPTIRKRFFMVARCDGKPIVWPAPTHGKPGSPEVLSGKRLPWRTAAEIIDWSIPCSSIFERKKPLAEKTLRRIAHGIMKFVVNNPTPFIVPFQNSGAASASSTSAAMPSKVQSSTPDSAPRSWPSGARVPHVTKFRSGAIGHGVDEPLATVTANSFIKRPGGSAPLGVVEAAVAPFSTYAQQGGLNRSVEDPLHTVTASSKDQNCIAAAVLQKFASGNAPTAPEEPLQTVEGNSKHSMVTAFMQKFADNGRGVDPAEPLHTVMAGAPRHAVVCAHIAQANSERKGVKAGRSAEDPLSTVTLSGSHQQVVTSNLVKLRGGEDSHVGSCGIPVDEPMHTICASGTHMAEVRAFLLKYYGTDQDPQLAEPLHTVTTKDRYGLVTVMIEGEEYVIVDIGMRMLTPRELFNAQGFPADYIIDVDAHGKPITKTAQVAKCGNSVCPPLSEALVRANMADEIAEREVRAA